MCWCCCCEDHDRYIGGKCLDCWQSLKFSSYFFTPNKMLYYYAQLFWVLKITWSADAKGLFPPAFSSAEKSSGSDVDTNLYFIPQSLEIMFLVQSWILNYRTWSIGFDFTSYVIIPITCSRKARSQKAGSVPIPYFTTARISRTNRS